jgi:ribosomal protein S27AE
MPHASRLLRAMPAKVYPHFEFCPRCTHQTLLSEPSTDGQLICLRCGILALAVTPGADPGLA